MKHLLIFFVLTLALTRIAPAATPASQPASRPASQPAYPPFNADVTWAIENRDLILVVNKSTQTIRPREQIDCDITIANFTGMALTFPVLGECVGAEIVPESDTSKTYLWVPPDPWPGPQQTMTIEKHQQYFAQGPFWFANNPLAGLPADRPYLPPGKYRWRLILRGTPLLASGWNTLTVAIPGLSDPVATLRTLRPKGRLIIVSHEPVAPNPGLSIFNFDLEKALRVADPGDTIYLMGGGVWELPHRLDFRENVWIVGEGADRTVLSITGDQPDQPLVNLRDNQRLEALTLTGGPADHRSALVRVQGKASPTLFQCALVPPEHAFAAIESWSEASPLLQNCIVISPIGDYGVFARARARPRIEYCTIISRGFGVGMMEHSLPTIKRSLIVGRCPGIISDDGEFSIADSIVWCTQTSTTYSAPVIRWENDPAGNMRVEPMPQVLQLPGMGTFDPGFLAKGPLLESLHLRPDGPGTPYGAFAGENGRWAVPAPKLAPNLPLDLHEILHPSTK